MTWASIAKRVLALPVLAIAGAYAIMAIWTQLIRAEIIENSTFAWFPSVAIVWACLCLLSCAFLVVPTKGREKAGEQAESSITSSEEE